MKKRITYVSPLQQGIVFAVLYGLISLIADVFVIIGITHGSFGAHGNTTADKNVGVILAIFLPVGYAVAGFILGIITAFLYNIVAKLTGGIELILEDEP